ncbi:MAG: Fur family transcriptional regulator [Rubripirellula sp.]|jgi:Fur family ferric uptake transcriptional regulator
MNTSSDNTRSIRDDIRAVGLRATPARVATLKLLRVAKSPMTHADVAEKLDDSGIDKATAFRNLNDMTDAGLLRRTELGDHVYRFEEIRLGEFGGESHPHFLCEDCGTVSCLKNVKLTAESLRESSKIGEVAEILLRGRCNACK